MTAPGTNGGAVLPDRCVDHIDYAGRVCGACGLEVDAYGNTEERFDHCSFPDCGCDGARLCMASAGASDRACKQNVEGMWSGKTLAQRRAVFALVGSLSEEPQS